MKDKTKNVEADTGPPPVFPMEVLHLKFELEHTTKSLVETKQRVDRLVIENKGLEEVCNQIKEDSDIVINTLRNESHEKDEELERLKIIVAQNHEESEKQKDFLVKQYESHISELETTISRLELQIQGYKSELDTLSEFKANRETILADLDHYKKSLEEATVQNKEKVAKLERKYYEEKVRLQKEVNQKVAEIKKTSSEEAIKRLEEATKQVFVQNKKLEEELQVHIKGNDSLTKAKVIAEEEAKKLAREIELHEERLEEYAIINHKQSKEIAKLTEQISILENQHQQTKKTHEQEKETIQNRRNKEFEDQVLDAKALRKLLELKTKELKNVRRLAQNVVLQRNELEQFFHEALDFTRAQIYAEKNGMGSLKFPSLTSKAQYESGAKVDISELSWEDKERVLRLLFAKINSVIKAPPPSIDTIQANTTITHIPLIPESPTFFLSQPNTPHYSHTQTPKMQPSSSSHSNAVTPPISPHAINSPSSTSSSVSFQEPKVSFSKNLATPQYPPLS
eukprot:TRINITY_DN1601_c0_g2_i1.p1 TRINITY_DN1601_c0_g2~~TRINITY_DN1601_c0_g2_i1.p1  ORF type:complete len:511 (+),score=142.15 TRINITY_DN1601_c0_g2_i1:101-1633(+)